MKTIWHNVSYNKALLEITYNWDLLRKIILALGETVWSIIVVWVCLCKPPCFCLKDGLSTVENEKNICSKCKVGFCLATSLSSRKKPIMFLPGELWLQPRHASHLVLESQLYGVHPPPCSTYYYFWILSSFSTNGVNLFKYTHLHLFALFLIWKLVSLSKLFAKCRSLWG